MVQNRTKITWKNVIKERERHVSSKLHMIYYLLIMKDTLFLRPSLHFTTLVDI
jgi:hypothetical protein